MSGCLISPSVKPNLVTSCAFYGDLYPNEECYDAKIADGLRSLLDARKKFAYGTQRDYFQEYNCIGFTREGDGTHVGCAVLISNASDESGLAFPMSPNSTLIAESRLSRESAVHSVRMNVGKVCFYPVLSVSG